jgi:HD-GYP domain-containing protein (c-di-GMP phosphodiesterase class II)
LLHDIGKVGLPATILEKEGPLTADERRQMEEHSIIGERILLNVQDYEEIASIVRHHHERIDGTGYPDGLRTEEIPLLARIIGVADAYNAMTSGRPYRAALSPRDALAQLASGSGSQFDPHVVAAFLEILSGSAEAYRRGARSDFALEAQRHPALRTKPAVAAA